MAKRQIKPYISPDLPSFEEVEAGGRLPELDGDRELIARAAGDLILYVHETASREANAAYAQGAITLQQYNNYNQDIRSRIITRRRNLGLGPRP